MQPHCETCPTKHRAPNSFVARIATQVFDMRHEHSRYKLTVTRDRNTPLLAFSARPTFHSCTRARASQSAATSSTCAVARHFMSARRDLKFRSAAANFKIKIWAAWRPRMQQFRIKFQIYVADRRGALNEIHPPQSAYRSRIGSAASSQFCVADEI